MGGTWSGYAGRDSDRERERWVCWFAHLALGLEQGEHVALPDGALDVPDDAPAGVVDELNTHLDAATLRPGPAEDLGDLSGGMAGWNADADGGQQMRLQAGDCDDKDWFPPGSIR